MKRFGTILRFLFALGFSMLAAGSAPARAQFGGGPTYSQTVTKHCGACGHEVSSDARVGQRCPYCGAIWGHENEKTTTRYVTPPPVYTPAEEVVEPEPARIGVTVNGTPIAFAGSPPITRGGRILVPLRDVFEALGASVAYDAASRSIQAVKGSRTVSLRVGSTAAQVNGQMIRLSAKPRVRRGTTLVPVRFVAEALGAQVTWDAQNSVVIVQNQ